MTTAIELVAKDIIDSAINIHKEFGPGLHESAYQQCLTFALRNRGRKVLTEVPLPIVYCGNKIDAGYRLDMLIDDLIIVENKALERILPLHIAQLLTYLKLKDCKLDVLLNWNVKLMKNGITRVVNGLVEPQY